MRPFVKLLATLCLTGAMGLATATESTIPEPAGSESSQPPMPAAGLSPKGASYGASPIGISFNAHPKGTSFAAKQVPWRDGAPSLLEPAATPGNPDYLFSMIPPAPPGSWDLLLGALLAGAFIARRRLRAD